MYCWPRASCKLARKAYAKYKANNAGKRTRQGATIVDHSFSRKDRSSEANNRLQNPGLNNGTGAVFHFFPDAQTTPDLENRPIRHPEFFPFFRDFRRICSRSTSGGDSAQTRTHARTQTDASF